MVKEKYKIKTGSKKITEKLLNHENYYPHRQQYSVA